MKTQISDNMKIIQSISVYVLQGHFSGVLKYGSVAGPERHADGPQRVVPAVPVNPVETRVRRLRAATVVVAAVREEVTTVATVPETAAAPSLRTMIYRVAVVFPVNS